jgi:hypothetical protein
MLVVRSHRFQDGCFGDVSGRVEVVWLVVFWSNLEKPVFEEV